jgi:hypothetical protein
MPHAAGHVGERPGAWRRRAVVAAAVIAAAAIAVLAWDRRQDAQVRAAGASIYAGQTDIGGRLATHTLDLPAAAAACANCHEAGNAPPAAASAAAPGGTASLAVPIRGAALTELRRRRGGPPSRIDAAGLCKLLRTGIDPVQVMVATAMPRYQPTDRQCGELWAYLVEI